MARVIAIAKKLVSAPAAPLLAVLVVAGIVFGPYLLRTDLLLGPRSGLGTDITSRHWADLTYMARVLQQEHAIPLWDDAAAGGRPLAGDPGVLWLYPFDLLFLVAPPAFAFNWLAALHAGIGGVGGYLFLRRGLRLSRLPALLGGSAWMLSPRFIAHLAGGHVGLTCAAAWIPLVLWGTHVAAEGRWKGALLAGASLALQLFVHAQIFFFTACTAAVYALWRVLTSPAKGRGRRLVTAALTGPAFVALSAAILFPLVGLLPYTSRQGFSLQDSAWYSLPPVLLSTLFSPGPIQFPEWVLYPGAVVLIMSFLALFGAARREALFWWAAMAFALVYAVGPATPLFSLLYHVPGFAQLRVPPRMWLIGGFAATVLAALGAEAVGQQTTTHNLHRWRHWVRRLAVVIIGGEATIAITLLVTRTPPWQLLTTLAVSLAAIGLLCFHLRGRLHMSTLRVALLVVSLAELIPMARLAMVSIPTEQILAETPALSFLRQQTGLWRVYSPQGALPYAPAAAAGVETVDALLPLQVGHAVELIELATGCRAEEYGTGVPPCLTAEAGPATDELQADLLGLLNVRYVLATSALDDPELSLVATFGSQRLYENRRWLPRAFVVFQTRILSSQEAVLDALPGTDPGQTALLADADGPVLGEPLPPVQATVVSRSANRMDVNVQVERPGLLIVSRTWMPGWRAWVDEQPTPVYRVDYALQGVTVPAGEHAVHFLYQPLGWRLGWPISAGALAVAVLLPAWAVLRLRAARQPRAGETDRT